jgi:hypothetical protein
MQLLTPLLITHNQKKNYIKLYVLNKVLKSSKL